MYEMWCVSIRILIMKTNNYRVFVKGQKKKVFGYDMGRYRNFSHLQNRILTFLWVIFVSMQRASFEIQQKSFIHCICIIFVTATSWHRLHTIWNWNNIVWIKNWYLWRTIRPSRTINPRFRAFFISSADYIRVMQFRHLLALGINHSGLHNHFLLILLLLYNTRIQIISWPLWLWFISPFFAYFNCVRVWQEIEVIGVNICFTRFCHRLLLNTSQNIKQN